MKKLLLSVLSTFLLSGLFATTYTSSGNGSWLTPTTWSPMGVPIDGDIVTINHDVILDTDFLLSSGSITINEGASLNESAAGRSLALNGGTFTNNGTVTISLFAANSGTFVNNGTFSGSGFYNALSLENYGNIGTIDSLLNEGTITNYADAYLDVTELFNDGSFSNAGIYEGTDFYNNSSFTNTLAISVTYFTNADTTYNTGNISFWDCTNLAGFNNAGTIYGENDFSNLGFFHNSDYFVVDHDFFNGDTAQSDAYFYNAGLVQVWNNFLNINTIDGSNLGEFCIANQTGNEGLFTGDFEFCDNSNPGSIDYNTGTIEAGVTYCTEPCGTGVEDVAVILPEIYPNPATSIVNIDVVFVDGKISISDVSGRELVISKLSLGNNQIDLSNLQSGTYLYRINDENGAYFNGKILIQR